MFWYEMGNTGCDCNQSGSKSKRALIRMCELWIIVLFVFWRSSAIGGAPTATRTYKLIEGDIVSDRKLSKMRNPPHSLLRTRERRALFKSMKTHEHRWQRGVVPYHIANGIGATARRAIHKAIRELERNTCIRLVRRTNERDYVDFINDDGCFSNIGRQGGRQVISVGRGCAHMNVVLHEILHALGMFHEHTRLDRTLYVRVLWWNVVDGSEKNFRPYDHNVIDSMKFDYDYDSITHYYNKEFSKNGGDTITALGKPQRRLGNAKTLSKIDLKKINSYYKCRKRRVVKKKAPCSDKMSWCKKYSYICKSRWFARDYCNKTCGVCKS